MIYMENTKNISLTNKGKWLGQFLYHNKVYIQTCHNIVNFQFAKNYCNIKVVSLLDINELKPLYNWITIYYTHDDEYIEYNGKRYSTFMELKQLEILLKLETLEND